MDFFKYDESRCYYCVIITLLALLQYTNC